LNDVRGQVAGLGLRAGERLSAAPAASDIDIDADPGRAPA
jgi:hypothetical protein